MVNDKSKGILLINVRIIYLVFDSPISGIYNNCNRDFLNKYLI